MIEKYTKKLEFEAIVKEKLKESELNQMEKMIKVLHNHNLTVVNECIYTVLLINHRYQF